MSNQTSKTTTSSGGIGFAGLLTILFIGLKLTNYIAWSWWWVLAPIWLPIAFLLGFAAICFLIAAVCEKLT